MGAKDWSDRFRAIWWWGAQVRASIGTLPCARCVRLRRAQGTAYLARFNHRTAANVSARLFEFGGLPRGTLHGHIRTETMKVRVGMCEVCRLRIMCDVCSGVHGNPHLRRRTRCGL